MAVKIALPKERTALQIKAAEYSRAYRLKNGEKTRANSAAWRKDNSEQIKLYRNSEKMKLYFKKYYLENKQSVDTVSNRWKKANPDKVSRIVAKYHLGAGATPELVETLVAIQAVKRKLKEIVKCQK